MNEKGFSLVETLVAISILMISIAGPMVLVGNGIRASGYSRDQITAFYLAQDAIEALRYIRDNNRIDIVEFTGDPSTLPAWDDLVNYNNCDNSNPCGIDTLEIYDGNYNVISQSTADDFLQIDSSGRYCYDCGEDTKFKRYIEIIDRVPGKEVELIVTVDWSSGIITRNFSIRENLFYWY